jgi:hypothetical protein
MKLHNNWLAGTLAVAGGLSIAGSVQAQYTVTTLSDFHNFNLSATYGNWDASGSQIINGGTGYSPTITSGPSNFEVNAQGYGSGAYDFSSPLSAPGATMFEITFTINAPSGGPFWMNPGVDITDGTHQVHLAADPASFPGASGGYLNYGNFTTGTFTLYGPLTDQFGGAPLDTSTITAFNLEFDPAGYGSSAPYDITYQSLVLLTPTPEPTTLALIGLGAAGVVIARRRMANISQ